jgi:hypothetical protein
MTVTTRNAINRPLANQVDEEIKGLIKLFEQQQKAESDRKKKAAVKPKRSRLLKKLARLV